MGKKRKIKEKHEINNPINEKKIAKKQVNENTKPYEDEAKIIVDFSSPTAFYSCRIDKFTNFCESHEAFIKFRKMLFGEALKYFSQHTFDELSRSKGSHTHIIDSKKIDLIEKILMELLKKESSGTSERILQERVNEYIEEVWQLGYKQGLRLIGIRKRNIFRVLFIDYHHLIHSDIKHNNRDVKGYNYCPMSS